MSPISREVKYPKPVFFYAASRALERAAYYGMRSILILYVTSEVLAFSYENVGTFYGWFILSFTVSNVIGAIFGDFVFGNKNALVIGSIIMALGMFLLCIPSTIGLYLGLLMIIVGSGFYTPNLMAKYGKQLYGVPHLLDGGFTLLYVMVNCCQNYLFDIFNAANRHRLKKVKESRRNKRKTQDDCEVFGIGISGYCGIHYRS